MRPGTMPSDLATWYPLLLSHVINILDLDFRLVSPHEGAPYEPGHETFITAPTEAVAAMTVVRVA